MIYPLRFAIPKAKHKAHKIAQFHLKVRLEQERVQICRLEDDDDEYLRCRNENIFQKHNEPNNVRHKHGNPKNLLI